MDFNLEDFKHFLNDKLENYKDKVKYWENARRNLKDDDTFYKRSYQTTIHKYNAKIETIKEILEMIGE